MKQIQAATLLVLSAVVAIGTVFSQSVKTKPGDTLITITGSIDGSEKFDFKPGVITWTHKEWQPPKNMVFAGVPWTDLKTTPDLWADLKYADITRARIVERSGRDIISLEPTEDGFTLLLSDSPNGEADYSVTILIPKDPNARIRTAPPREVGTPSWKKLSKD